jgi:hypothetical protein
MGSLFLTFSSSFRVPKGQKTPIIPLEAIQTFLFHPKEPRKKSVHRRLTLAFLPKGQKDRSQISREATGALERWKPFLNEVARTFSFSSPLPSPFILYGRQSL